MNMENNEQSGTRQALEKSLLEYKGQLSGEVHIQLLELIRCIALLNLGPRNDLKKLISIALELLDNAERYNSRRDVEFKWRIVDDQLVVTVTNTASSTDAQRLMESVAAIDRMSAEQLTQAFKRQMADQNFGAKGGAGLGILQIARKVGRNITADVRELKPDEYLCTSTVSTLLGNGANPSPR